VKRAIAPDRQSAAGRLGTLRRARPAGGEYRIAATTDPVPRDLSEEGALVRLAEQSAAFTLVHGEKETFDLKIGR
jgi:hypothetical protein